MCGMASDIVLLTYEFPFGSATETFLETEIRVLADRFRRVYVLPSRRVPGRRPLPRNCEIVEMDWLRAPGRRSTGEALASAEALGVLMRTIRLGKALEPYRRWPRKYAQILAREILKLRALQSLVRDRRLENAVFYDYWFENSTLAIALLRRHGHIGAAVARAHGFDLYDERWEAGCVPFREAKLEGLDAVFAVSTYGQNYMARKVPAFQHKVRLARLGVSNSGATRATRARDVPLVLTCGSLVPLKCIHLVPDVLALVGRPLRWIHLGDGPERERVARAARRLPSSVTYELRGQVPNSGVLRVYAEEQVDVLLSLSTTEGLPVSMMEAQSYGVPTVARAVGGVPEIVTEATGLLLGAAASPADAASALREALAPGRFSAAIITSFYRRNFDATANYNRFVDALLTLAKGDAPPAAIPNVRATDQAVASLP